MKCINDFVLENGYKEDPKDKKALYNAIQNEWYKKNFYVDVAGNKFMDISESIKQTRHEKDFDILYLNDSVAEKSYSFMAKFNNKEYISEAVLGNLLVLHNILKNKTEGASQNLESQTVAAQGIQDKLQQIDFNYLDVYRAKTFPSFRDQHKDLCIKEEKRLKDIIFYDNS